MSLNDKDKSVRLLRGKRLQAIREFKKQTDKEYIEGVNKKEMKWTRKYVAKKMNLSEQAVKDHEKGKVIIDEGLAMRYAKEYNASFDFIMGFNDDMFNTNNFGEPNKEKKHVAESEKQLIKLLEAMGFQITFEYTPYYSSSDSTLNEKEKKQRKVPVSNNTTTIDCLENFSLSDYKCYLIDKDTNAPVSIILTDVIIEEDYEIRMSFSVFGIFVLTLLNDIYSKVRRSHSLSRTLNYYFWQNSEIKEQLLNIRLGLTNIDSKQWGKEYDDLLRFAHENSTDDDNE